MEAGLQGVTVRPYRDGGMLRRLTAMFGRARGRVAVVSLVAVTGLAVVAAGHAATTDVSLLKVRMGGDAGQSGQNDKRHDGYSPPHLPERPSQPPQHSAHPVERGPYSPLCRGQRVNEVLR